MSSSKSYSVTSWVGLGAFVEYYDFVIYGMMIKYLAPIFFSSYNEYSNTVQTFLVFAVGYFARPLGGVLFGYIGDRHGRKTALLALTALMALSTLTLGLLPTAKEIGGLAPALLIICRLAQGISFGGELPGATTIVGEFASRNRQGWFSSLIVTGTSLGALMASFVLFLLTFFLKENDLMCWGWRIPFIAGGSMGIALLMIRWRIEETPVFENLVNPSPSTNPLFQLLREDIATVLKGLLLTMFLAALVIVNLYYTYYLPAAFNYLPRDVYLWMTLSLVFSAIILPVVGKISDSVPRSRILVGTPITYVFFSFPLFGMLSLKNVGALALFLMSHQLFIAVYSAAYFPTMVNLFPPQKRYTGFALCYSVAYALMALLPSILTSLLEYSHFSVIVVPTILLILALMSWIPAKLLFNHKLKNAWRA